MKTQTSFVRANGTVHLDTITSVDTEIPFIINPWHTEHDDPFGFHHSFQDGCFFVLWIFFDERDDRLSYFKYCLEKLGLRWVSSFYQLHEFVNGRTVSCYHMLQVSRSEERRV